MFCKKIRATRWLKCVCCGEQIRSDEKHWQVFDDTEAPLKRERYCRGCAREMYENNPGLQDCTDGDNERGLRMMGEYAAYQAAGCTSAFWGDMDSGYIR
jgi:hypothetical protein